MIDEKIRKEALQHAGPYGFVQFLDYFGSALWLLTASLFWITELGYGSTQVAILLTVGWVIQVVLEIPSGTLSDLAGHRVAVALSFAMQVVYCIFYIVIVYQDSQGAQSQMPLMPLLVVAEAFKKGGLALLSGSLEAWASAPIARIQANHHITEAQRRALYEDLEIPAKNLVSLGMAVGGAVAFALVGSGVWWRWYAVWLFSALTNLTLLLFMTRMASGEARGSVDMGSLYQRTRSDFERLSIVCSEFLFNEPAGRRFAVVMAVNSLAYSMIYFVSAFWAPLMFDAAGVRIDGGTGAFTLFLVWCAISCGSVLGAYASKDLIRHFRENDIAYGLVYSVIMGVVAVMFFVLWWVHSLIEDGALWAVGVMAVFLASFKFCEALIRPLASTLSQQTIAADRARATLLSVEGYVRSLAASFVLLCVGMTGEYGLALMWLAAAALAAVVSIWLAAAHHEARFVGALAPITVFLVAAVIVWRHVPADIDAVLLSSPGINTVSIQGASPSVRLEPPHVLSGIEARSPAEGGGTGVKELEYEWSWRKDGLDGAGRYEFKGVPPVTLFMSYGSEVSDTLEAIEVRNQSETNLWRTLPFRIVSRRDVVLLVLSASVLSFFGFWAGYVLQRRREQYREVLDRAQRLADQMHPERQYDAQQYPLDYVIGLNDALSALGVVRFAVGVVDWNDERRACVLRGADLSQPVDSGLWSENLRLLFEFPLDSGLEPGGRDSNEPRTSVLEATSRTLNPSDISSESIQTRRFLGTSTGEGRAVLVTVSGWTAESSDDNAEAIPTMHEAPVVLLAIFKSTMGTTATERLLLERLAGIVNEMVRLSRRHFLNFHSEFDRLDETIRALVHDNIGRSESSLMESSLLPRSSETPSPLDVFDILRQIRRRLGERLNGRVPPALPKSLRTLLRMDLGWISRAAIRTSRRAGQDAGTVTIDVSIDGALVQRLDELSDGGHRVRAVELVDFWIVFANLIRNAIEHGGRRAEDPLRLFAGLVANDASHMRIWAVTGPDRIPLPTWRHFEHDGQFRYKERSSQKGLLLMREAAARLNGRLEGIELGGGIVPSLVLPIT